MGFSKLSVSLLALAGSAAATDLPAIVGKGSKFFYENGTQFFMKGVAYQQDTAAAGATNSKTSSFVDPLSNAKLCKRDVPLLKELGTNTIRTYAIDPEADHSDCMKMLNDAGIYVVSDLGQPEMSINRDEPVWDTELFTRYQKVVDEMAKYPNTIGFFAGNEVSNNKTNTGASAYVKAAVRDTKKYIKDKGGRWMGVGYAANDDADIREEIAHYFNCGTEEESIDFWGYNIYSWCGKSSMQKSGYSDQAKFFADYSVPVFFAEYGCNEPGGAADRLFEETAALYSDEMTEVFSGGIVYMYFQEDNDYGLVKADKGGKVSKLDDFSTLKKQVNKADPKGVDADSYKPTNKVPTDCPALSDSWQAASDLPPTPDTALCKCMTESRSCGPSKGLSSKSFGSIFGFICGADPDLCAGINGNATTGVYGAYSMCSDSDKLTYVLDAYYTKLDNAADACDFKGDASVLTPNSRSSCSESLKEADKVNAAAAAGKTASVSGDAADASSTDADSFGAISAPMARAFAVGDFGIGLHAFIAGLAGVAMIAL